MERNNFSSNWHCESPCLSRHSESDRNSSSVGVMECTCVSFEEIRNE